MQITTKLYSTPELERFADKQYISQNIIL